MAGLREEASPTAERLIEPLYSARIVFGGRHGRPRPSRESGEHDGTQSMPRLFEAGLEPRRTVFAHREFCVVGCVVTVSSLPVFLSDAWVHSGTLGLGYVVENARRESHSVSSSIAPSEVVP